MYSIYFLDMKISLSKLVIVKFQIFIYSTLKYFQSYSIVDRGQCTRPTTIAYKLYLIGT